MTNWQLLNCSQNRNFFFIINLIYKLSQEKKFFTKYNEYSSESCFSTCKINVFAILFINDSY